MTEFENYLKAIGASENTIKAYLNDIKPYLEGGLEKFINSLTHLKQSSKYRKICALKKYLSFKQEQVQLPKIKYKSWTRNYKLVDYKELLNKIMSYEGDQYLKLLFLLMLKLGLRVSEALSISKDNIVGDYLVIVGKGNEQAKLLLDPVIKEMIENTEKKKMSRNLVYYYCKKILGLSPHNLRALFITEIAKRDLSIARVLARHKNIQTTTRYIVIDENRIREILSQL